MAVYFKDGGGSTTSSTQSWYFNGRRYTSYTSYAQAVNAYRQAQEAASAREAAARQAAQTADRQRALAAEQARRLQAAEYAAYRQRVARRAAEAAEARRAAAIRSQQSLLTEQAADAQAAELARRRAQFEAAAAERAAAEREAIAKRQELAAAARRRAFATLQNQWQSRLVQRAQRAAQVQRANTLQLREQGVARTTGDPRLDEKLRAMRETVSPADVRRGRLLEQARQTGDYESVFSAIRKDLTATGGRFLDRKLYDQAKKEADQLLGRVQSERDDLVARVYEAFDAENWVGVMQLVDSPEWKAVMERYEQYFGAGIDPGRAIRWTRLRDVIARDRNRWIDSQTVGPQTERLLTELDIRNRERSFRQDHLQQRQLPGRTPRLEGNYTERSLTDWLNDEEKLERARYVEARRSSVEWAQRVRKHGYYGDPVEFDSRGQMVLSADADDQRQFDSMRALFTGDGRTWQGVISEVEFARLLNDLNNGLPVDKERAQRRLTELGADAYRQRDGALWDRAAARVRREDFPDTRQGQLDFARSAMAARTMAEEVSRRNLERFLTGGVTTGFVGELSRAGTLPLLRDIGPAYNRVLGSTTSLVRLLVAGATGGGNIALPDVQVDALFGSGNPFLRTPGADGGDLGASAFDVTPEARQRYSQEMRELLAVIGDPNTPLERRLDAIAVFGRGWATGNTSILAEAAIDPFSFVGVGRVLRGGRLASASAGGARAALRNPTAFGRDLLKYSLPARLGGTSEREIRVLAEKLRLANASGQDFAVVRAMSDEDLAALARETMNTSFEQAAKSGAWKKLVESDPVQAQQLFSAVSKQAEDLAQLSGVRRVTSATLQQDIDYARQAFAKAQAQERALAARVQREAAETAGADALEKLRMEQARAGVAPPVAREASPLTPFLKGKRTTIVKRYESLVSERLSVAKRAKSAMEKIELARDGDFRRAYFKELDESVERLRQLDDQITHEPVTGARQVVDGEITRARQEIEAFDTANKSSGGAPGFVGITMHRVNQDVKFIQGEIVAARAKLQAASTPGQIRFWTNRLTKLGAAKDYLDVERRLQRGAARTARRSMRKHVQAAKRAINLNRVASRAVTSAAGRESLLRDLRRRVVGASVDRTYTRAPAKRLAEIDEVEKAIMQSTMPADVYRLLADLRQQFGDVDLMDLAYALWAGRQGWLSGEALDLWQGMHDAIFDGIARARNIPRHRVTNNDVDLLMDSYASEQLLTGPRMTLRSYRKLDDQVSQAIRDVRGWSAKGQIRLRPASRGQSTSFTRHDGALAELYAKLGTLKRLGYGLEQYDKARTVLSDINLRHNRGVTLRRRAQARARATGRPLAEVFDELREDARLDEVTRNLEQIAARHPGLSEDEIFSLFELQMIDQDLAPFAKRPLDSYQAELLADAYRDVAGADVFDQQAAFRLLGEGASEHPPFGNRSAMHEWMIEHGHWSPRTADEIRAGNRVFSIEAERDFWETGFGFTPDWTDENWLLPKLRNKDAYDAAFREVGVFNNDFERLMATSNLKAEKLREAMVFGGEGIKRSRSWEELRHWAIERYGKLVSDDGVTLKEMPWLMDLDEYDDWIGRSVFDEPLMKASGIEFDPKMVKPGQRRAFARAVSEATRKSFERAKKAGEFDEAWLPQEQVRFVMDVVDHLMTDPRWRSFFAKRSAGARVLDNVGAFWRAAMTWTPSFPIMNLLDSVGLKRGILAATQNGFRPLSRVSDLAKEMIPEADVLGGRGATWYVRGRTGFVNSLDPELPGWTRIRELGRGFTELPVRVSKFGEDRIRLDFGRSMFDRHYKDLIDSGVADELARTRAMAFAKSQVDTFFPDLSKAGTFERVLNQLVPFFSYNLRLNIIGTKLTVENPWLLLMGERLGDFVEAQNRLIWASEHGDVPFPENDPAARRLWLKIGDTVYTVDLSSMSDYTRALEALTEPETPLDLVTQFFRVPHPSQAIFLAKAFGFNDGKTPWGTEATWEDVSIWFDFASWLRSGGGAVFDPNDPRSRDGLQMLSQMLFFKSFGRVGPMKVKVQEFFAFMALDEAKAWEYYNENEDLQAYFKLNGTRYRIDPGVTAIRRNWFQIATDEQRDEYNAAFDGFRSLRESLDANLERFFLEPWSSEYRAAKKRRRALLTAYLKENPILGDVWGFEVDAREWAELQDEWLVDEQVDAYFALDDTKPMRDAFAGGTAGELAYTKELAAWYDARAAWLEAHPRVYDRLHQARFATERSWFEQELQWGEILDRTADVKIKLLETDLAIESAPDDEDLRALSSALHELQSSNYARLDTESFGDFYDQLAGQRLQLSSLGNRLLGRLQRAVVFPGRADLRYENASPAERRQIREDQRYDRGMDRVWETIGNDVTRFYDELSKDPWLLNEYWRRNPEKRAAYVTGNEYRGWMGRWVAALEADDFVSAQQIWDSMPAWVHERYFAKHPDSKMRDGMGGGGTAVQYKGRWFKSAESRDRYIRFIENGEPSTAVLYEGKWFRSPESRDRYIRWIEGGSQGEAPPVDGEEIKFRSAESRQRFLDGQAYFASMQEWIKLLKEKRYDEADTYFRQLPAWMQEKYFTKHPDQRAKHDLDSESLKLGANYFLADTDEGKLEILRRNPQLRRWLAEHGGDESAMRGLIHAIYRAIPSTESWLRRTFRLRHPEVFGQEAAGERRLARVARSLAEHPEMRPFYDRAFALQTRLYREQVKRSKVPPRPWEMERKRRLRKRTKRRGARFHSTWAMHFEARRGLRNSAGS